MRRSPIWLATQRRPKSNLPLVQIKDGTFYRQHPAATAHEEAKVTTDDGGELNQNPPLFPGLSFTLPAFSSPVEKWCVISKLSEARTTFLQILRGQHISVPPTARAYPYLTTPEVENRDKRLQSPQNAIRYVGFDAERGSHGGSGLRGSYLSARYESRREEVDFSLRDFLTGNTELNADEHLARRADESKVVKVLHDLRLEQLADMPVTLLSNGQTRRAMIARALLSNPELLLLDGPFMGLDPFSAEHLSELLDGLAEAQAPRLILSLKPDESIPDWITHVAFLRQNYELGLFGPKKETIQGIHDAWNSINKGASGGKGEDEFEIADVSRRLFMNMATSLGAEDRFEQIAYYRDWMAKADKSAEMQWHRFVRSRDGFPRFHEPITPGEDIISMEGVCVRYGDKAVLGDWKQDVDGEEKHGLWWTVKRGQRWGIFGPNGSGKTTLVSLITSDHPQAYSLPIKLFGRSRLPEPGRPGISIFDLQRRIGHSSPEVHAFFPKHLSLRRTIESAWADTPLTTPRLTFEDDEKVSAALSWFRAELVPSLGPSDWMKAEMTRATVALETGRQRQMEKEFDSENLPRALKRAKEKMTGPQLEELDLLEWAENINFGEVGFSAQRVLLFIRAVIRHPDLVVLDEAFSGMDDFAKDKCKLFLSHGEGMLYHHRQYASTLDKPVLFRSDLSRLGLVRVTGLKPDQALIVISHKKEEVPGCVQDWIRLPESGTGDAPRFGQLEGPMELLRDGWRQIWGHRVALTASTRKGLISTGEYLKIQDWPHETEELRAERLKRLREFRTTEGLLPTRSTKSRLTRKVIDSHELKTRSAAYRRAMFLAESAEERKRRNLKTLIIKREARAKMDPEALREMFREKNKKYLSAESPEQKERRLKKNAETQAKRMAALNAEEKQEHNKRHAELRRLRIAKMDEEQRAEMKRARNNAARRWKARLMTLPDEVKERYREKQRGAYRRQREAMTAEQREAVLQKQREYNALYKARKKAERMEEKKRRLNGGSEQDTPGRSAEPETEDAAEEIAVVGAQKASASA